MRSLRIGFALLLVSAFGLSVDAARGQTSAKQLEPFKKIAPEPGEARGKITEYKEGKFALTKPTKEDRDVFHAMGQYLVNRVTYPEYLIGADTAELKPRPPEKTVNELIGDLRKFLIVPPADGKLTLPQEDYIRELGIALDKSLAAILLAEKGKAPPAIVRVNAGRLLAVACESGAPAHWPTVIALLKNPETPPELYYYALKGADGLLGGFDVARLGRLDATPEQAETTFHDLIRLLEDAVVKGPPILGKIYVDSSQPTLVTDPKAKPSALLPEQIVAIRLFRLQAIRALGRLRSDTIAGKVKPATEVRPVFALARVAIGDPAIGPAFNNKEIAEAVIGLARINPGANLNVDELAYAMAFGTRVVFSAKASNADDVSLPWKGYASRMNAAFQEWQANCAKNARVVAKQKDSINSLVKKSNDGLFAPTLNPTAGAGGMNAVQLAPVDEWLQSNKPASDRQLFSDVKTFKLTYSDK